MQTYIAMLRGINVSGQKKIAMKDLKALFEDSGFKNVRTYIQSGNVIFGYRKEDERKLEAKIGKAIKAAYDFHVSVLVRTPEALAAAAERNPFLKEEMETGRLYITFLASEPSEEHLQKTRQLSFEPERFIISGREIYLYCPEGYGTSKLSNNFFESRLKLPATTRNLRTVDTLIRLATEG